MKAKKLLYISTNSIWSGSEILWYRSAKAFINIGYTIGIVSSYSNSEINDLDCDGGAKFNLNERFKNKSWFGKITTRIFLSPIGQRDQLLSFIKTFKPDLIIISQGNNIDSLDFQKLCIANNFKYCTITQLVTEFHWLFINSESLSELQSAYSKASKNFFISQANIDLHNKMIAQSFANNELVYNPACEDSTLIKYPNVQHTYNLAFVGRIECFHKGLDILLEVISYRKWQNRNLTINIYGDGPHYSWVIQTIGRLKINNVYLKGTVKDVKEIWAENHLLILPSRMEGQSLALIEAQMFGRAAIVTNVGGASEIIEDNITGFLASYPNCLFLDEALERAWDERENWQQIGNRARAKMKKDFPEDVIEHFNSKLKELL